MCVCLCVYKCKISLRAQVFFNFVLSLFDVTCIFKCLIVNNCIKGPLQYLCFGFGCTGRSLARDRICEEASEKGQYFLLLQQTEGVRRQGSPQSENLCLLAFSVLLVKIFLKNPLFHLTSCKCHFTKYSQVQTLMECFETPKVGLW